MADTKIIFWYDFVAPLKSTFRLRELGNFKKISEMLEATGEAQHVA